MQYYYDGVKSLSVKDIDEFTKRFTELKAVMNSLLVYSSLFEGTLKKDDAMHIVINNDIQRAKNLLKEK